MPLNRSDVQHLLRRVGFGSTAAETSHFEGRELDEVLDEMFAFVPAAASPPSSVLNKTLWYESRAAMSDWWIDRMAAARWVGSAGRPSPLLEKLALFWHSHFACGTGKVRDFDALWRQLDAYYRMGLGDFESLTRSVIVDGGMLVYFDNFSNTKGRPQENLARELMELHTVGVGNFSEGDVIAMARAWTGHGVASPFGDRADLTHRFRRGDHDGSPKALFGLAPRRWDGPDTITELIKGTKRDATAAFIATKLWHYYVDSTPTRSDIDGLADTFAGAGMRVEPLLRAILEHPTFWSGANRWAMVRQPIEWAADVLRRFDIAAPDSHITRLTRFMGQDLFNPPNVAGWGTNQYWVSTTAVWGKARFLKSIREHPNVAAAFADIEDGSRADAVERVLSRFGVEEASNATRARIGEWFDDLVADQPRALQRDAVYMGGLAPEVQVA